MLGEYFRYWRSYVVTPRRNQRAGALMVWRISGRLRRAEGWKALPLVSTRRGVQRSLIAGSQMTLRGFQDSF